MIQIGDRVKCIHNHWHENGLDSDGPGLNDQLVVESIHWVNGQPWLGFNAWPKSVFLYESFEPVALDLNFAQGVLDYITLTAAKNE